MENYRKKLGDWGERLAKEYLVKKGYKILATHFQKREGEIDIVAQQGKELVFVEVKTRKSSKFGSPEESIDFYKQQKLEKAIGYYLIKHPPFAENYRLDCILIELDNKGKVKIRHYKHLEIG